ncbi:MAG: hypothetical protein ACHQNV_10515, partial [Vicinamibacteria bacterium]
MNSLIPQGLLACAFLALARPAVAEEPELFPDASLRLQGARYAPVYPDLHWDTWIGAGAGLLRVGDATIYFRADVETIAGNTRRAFDAAQVNYHLEPGVRVNLGQEREADIFFHHVSRHVIDTEKTPSVEWNIVGLGGSMSVPRHPIRLTASIGHEVQEANVHYQWELVGQIEADALRRPWGAVYVTTLGRGV